MVLWLCVCLGPRPPPRPQHFCPALDPRRIAAAPSSLPLGPHSPLAFAVGSSRLLVSSSTMQRRPWPHMASARHPCSASRTTSLPARAEPERGEGPIRVPSSTGTPLVQRALRACRGRFGSQGVTYASGNNTDPPMRLDVARARGMPSYACAVNNLVVQWKHMPLARHLGFDFRGSCTPLLTVLRVIEYPGASRNHDRLSLIEVTECAAGGRAAEV